MGTSAQEYRPQLPLAIVGRRLGFTHYVLVPCSILSSLFDHADDADNVMYACREEEAIAIGCGLSLAGAKPLVMMQNSGLASSLNSIGSLAIAYSIPLCVVVTMRGGASDVNPAQMPVGGATEKLIQALGCDAFPARTGESLTMAVEAAVASGISGRRPAFVTVDVGSGRC